MCSRSDSKSVSGRLRFYLSKGPMRPDFLNIYLTTFFKVRKFKNRSAMRVIFLLKMIKIESKFQKCNKTKKKDKKYFFEKKYLHLKLL